MKIQEIINDESRLFVKDNIPETYTTDLYMGQLKPLHAVALPKSHEEIVSLVDYAIQEDLKIIARGANTGVAGAQVPIDGNELIIDVSLMNEIIELDESTFTLTVQPGVLVGDIHEYVESRDYFYPPDPASKHSSIGGNVATNAGGLRAVKYGTTRDYVKQLKVVLATGETMDLGSLNIKSSSGYDLLDLFIGSEGTLGITSEIKLKVLPLPKMSYSILLSFENVFKATEATLTLLNSGVNPSEIELFEKDAVYYATQLLGHELPTKQGHAYLLVEIDGDDKSELDIRLNSVLEHMKHLALETIPLVDIDEKLRVKKIRDNILIGLMEYTQYEMLDEVVPINQFANLIAYTKELEQKHGLSVLNFGHAGDGNIHTVLMKNDLTDEEWTTKRKALLDDLYAKVKDLGGLPSAEHGIGIVKKAYLHKMSDEVNMKYMRSIKNIFDPENRLNPGKII